MYLRLPRRKLSWAPWSSVQRVPSLNSIPHGGLRGLTVAVHDPASVAATWSELIGVAANGSTIVLDGGRQEVRFVDAAPTDVERIVEVRATAPGHAGEATIAGVRFVCQEEDA